MSQSVRLADVWAMLDECAPGYSATEGDHYWSILHPNRAKTFNTLPTGKHGARRPEAEIGHVRQMVRLFEIQDCAAKHFPGLIKKSKKH